MRLVAPFLAVLSLVSASTPVTPVARSKFETLAQRDVVGADLCATVDIDVPGRQALCNALGFNAVTCALGLVGTLLSLVGDTPLLTDICLCVDGNVLTEDSVANVQAAITADLASSSSVIAPLLNTLQLLGISALRLVSAIAPGLVAEGAAGCPALPANSFATCTAACSFECNPGFFDCDGVCLENGSTCGSARRRRRSLRTDLDCPAGKSACGIPSMPGAFECLDTRFDVESCGGCLFPLPGRQSGTDCTALPNVARADCMHGRCVVQECTKGHEWNGIECAAPGAVIGTALESAEAAFGDGIAGAFVKGLGKMVSPRQAERAQRHDAKRAIAARQAKARDVAGRKERRGALGGV